MGLPRGIRAVATTAVLLVFTSNAWAEVCRGSKIRVAQLRQYDRAIFLSTKDIQESEETNLPFGKPQCGRYLYQAESVICYDSEHRVPTWAAYRLRRQDVISKERRDAFRTDPRLTEEETSSCADYAGSGYDRGHIVPRHDMNRTFQAQAFTFYLSNMAPQTPSLNRGMWRWLEESVRAWAKQYGQVYVITGSVFEHDAPGTVASGRVSIPDKFYKIVLRRDNEHVLAITLILPNQIRGLPVPPGSRGIQGHRVNAVGADAYLQQHIANIADVEHGIHVDLLPALSGATKEALERAVASELWPRN